MIPVYQTIVDAGKGNCMQAAVASLFEMQLDEVPNFIELDNPNHVFLQMALDKGYDVLGSLYNYPNSEYSSIHRLKDKDLIGIKGLFYASVYSPKYYDKEKGINRMQQVTHAVLIDKNYNIVFDPNPNYKGLLKYPEADVLGYNGILNVTMINEK
jgi:hypothetical protein